MDIIDYVTGYVVYNIMMFYFTQFMKRRSHGAEGREETDSGAVLTEKWVVANAPPPVKGYNYAKCIHEILSNTEFCLLSLEKYHLYLQ